MRLHIWRLRLVAGCSPVSLLRHQDLVETLYFCPNSAWRYFRADARTQPTPSSRLISCARAPTRPLHQLKGLEAGLRPSPARASCHLSHHAMPRQYCSGRIQARGLLRVHNTRGESLKCEQRQHRSPLCERRSLCYSDPCHLDCISHVSSPGIGVRSSRIDLFGRKFIIAGMPRRGDTLFKATTGFLGLATAATGAYLVASMIGAYASAKVHTFTFYVKAFASIWCAVMAL